MSVEVPAFSIVVPCYNSWRFMERGLRSLEQQIFNDFEVLFIDDCSLDDTYMRLVEYQQISKLNIRILRNEENSGPGQSRNSGIQQAKGEYLAFMDSDDWYELDYLDRMYATIAETNAELVCCDFYRCFNTGKRIGVKVNRHLEFADQKRYVASAFTSLSCLVVRKTLAQEVLIPAIYHGEDAAVIPVWLARAKQVAYAPKMLYNYMYRDKSLSTSVNINVIPSVIDSFCFIQNSIDISFTEEIEFRGICMLLYASVFKSVEAGCKYNMIRKKLCVFTEKYPLWHRNLYIKTLPFRKRIFLFLVRYELYAVLKLYVWGQKVLLSRM